MQTQNRPLSPHLQVYKPQLTSIMSISHRASGVALSLGILLLVYWLAAAAAGPDAFARAQGIVGSFLGQVILFLFSYALFYHLCNGIRHLFWDAGKGFELKTAYASGYAVLAVSAALTLLVWIIAFATGGA
ncbi:MAG: succinate dehydrogenase, cytochrome b556 subunit [Ectothiorhodospiraceae bacterium]|nr:succinate dehydrogenase, cytochrome b556 subunit [Ectothiorhodospiraceae bacterium]